MPSNNFVYQGVSPNPQIAAKLFSRSYLLMNSFENEEGFCVRILTYFYIFLLAGTYLQYAHIPPLLYLLVYFCFVIPEGNLPNVAVLSAEPGTTDASIEIDIPVPSGIIRPIVGYERHVLSGVTLQGEYANNNYCQKYTVYNLITSPRC